MDIFTSEEIRPSEKTLEFIRQFARLYHTGKRNGVEKIYCVN